jgi:uncharacterized protein YjiS (DUF1127 family)
MRMHTARSFVGAHGFEPGRARGDSRGLVVALLRAIGSGVRQLVDWNRYRKDLRELQRMDDRLLADIGISRSDLENLVSQGRRVPETTPALTDSRHAHALIWSLRNERP